MKEKIQSLIQKYEKEIKQAKNKVFSLDGMSYKDYQMIEKIYKKHIEELKNLIQ